MAINELAPEETLTLEEAKTTLEWVLRNIRRVKEMNQQVLSDKAWISLPTVQRMEGWNTPLTFKMLMQVCMALNIRLSTIILIILILYIINNIIYKYYSLLYIFFIYY